MQNRIYIDSKGTVYKAENLAEGLIFQSSRKITEQFVTGIPKDAVRVEGSLASNLDKLMYMLEE